MIDDCPLNENDTRATQQRQPPIPLQRQPLVAVPPAMGNNALPSIADGDSPHPPTAAAAAQRLSQSIVHGFTPTATVPNVAQ